MYLKRNYNFIKAVVRQSLVSVNHTESNLVFKMSVLAHDAVDKPRQIIAAKKLLSVAEWYNGQTILISGATGFMGKVLLEKLLRACSGLKKIYIIVRSKRGTAPSTRIKEMLKLPVILFLNLINSIY